MTQAVHLSRAAAPRLSLVLTGLSVGLLILCISAGLVDQRLVEGVPNWQKPAKFAASFGVLFATFAWLETRLSEPWREGRVVRVTLWICAICFVAEMAYLMYQAGLAEPTHFNFTTPFHAFMYTVVMFVGAVLLVLAVGVFGTVTALDKNARLSPGLRFGVILGFGLSCCLTLVLATYMGGQASRFVGTPPLDARSLPVLGWSMDVGDLRPSHFFALHAMQVLPVLGWGMDRARLARPHITLAGAAFLYTAVTLGLFVQARMGLPITSFVG